MAERKFYRTSVTFDVLSEEPIPEAMELSTILAECDEGDYLLVPHTAELKTRELTPQELVAASYEAYSDPGFFQLNDKGEKLNG